MTLTSYGGKECCEFVYTMGDLSISQVLNYITQQDTQEVDKYQAIQIRLTNTMTLELSLQASGLALDDPT